jgi:hypothetical protein
MATPGREEWNQYGARFLAQLEENQDWGSIDAVWRYGGPEDLTPVAEVMARSGDSRLAWLLAKALTGGRYVEQVPTLPTILHQHAPRVTGGTAGEVLERLLSDEEPLKAPYAGEPHLVIGWLMRQPGSALDDLAVEIALGGHQFSDTPEPKDAAIDRISRSPGLAGRTVQGFIDNPALWATGHAWTRTADVLGRLGNPKGRADLVRAMTTGLISLPPEEAVQPSAAFAVLMEKHATGEIRDALEGDPLGDTPGVKATILAVAQFKPGAGRDDLVEILAARQAALWSAHRAAIYSSWTTADWDRMLTRWGTPGSTLIDAGEVIDDAPTETDTKRIRVAFAHRGEPGDYAARVAQGALKHFVEGNDEPHADVPAVVGAVPWDLIEGGDARKYLGWIFEQTLTPSDRRSVLLAAYTGKHVNADLTAGMMPTDEIGPSLLDLETGSTRAAYASALYDWHAEDLDAVFRSVIDESNDTFDIVEALAARDRTLAFGTFGLDRWHDLDNAQKDQLLILLEEHATLDQEPLLDLIAHDSDGPNAPRRARAARRWAALAELHSVIPPGVLSLLESNRENLTQAFAEIAAEIQPRDEGTLISLQAKWLNGGKTGGSARAALDNVATGLVASLGELRPPDRREHCPSLLHLLGITAAPYTFPTLLAYVGADAIDDNVDLRRCAAAAIRAFVDITTIDGDKFDALSRCVATETDPTAASDLRNASAAGNLGDDAAILGLYDIVGLAPDEVGHTPDELFGTQKVRLLTALKKLRVQQVQGEPGWDGYVEQMDLVGEALVRTAYLRFGPSASLKAQISADTPNDPDYGTLVKAIANAKDFSAASAHLQTVHHIRSTRTAAHHPSGGDLDSEAITQTENALRTGATEILNRLRNDGPRLHPVPEPGTAGEEVS